MTIVKFLSAIRPYVIITSFFLFACNEDETAISAADCFSDIIYDDSRGACSETLSFTNQVTVSIANNTRIITANSIPNHKVGLFGNGPGSLGPNVIKEQSETYTMTMNPQITDSLIALLGDNGPEYKFGVLLNGVLLDPVAAEPYPHKGIMDPYVNWKWNLEALYVNLGLDCNNAHVQPTGQYHYHGSPLLYIERLNLSPAAMTLIGYAADGFPIYFKYAYEDAMNASSAVLPMTSGYRLKTGNRKEEDIKGPCGEYDGTYSNDYEYIVGLGTLDEANGRYGITPDYPNGIYYYVITDDFPSIPRYFRGTPSNDFAI